MKLHTAAMAFAVAIAPIGSVSAAEGANTGSATSTPAGPAGDNQGPSKMSNPSTRTGGAMKGSMSGTTAGAGAAGMTSGSGGDSAAGGGSRNGDHGN